MKTQKRRHQNGEPKNMFIPRKNKNIYCKIYLGKQEKKKTILHGKNYHQKEYLKWVILPNKYFTQREIFINLYS